MLAVFMNSEGSVSAGIECLLFLSQDPRWRGNDSSSRHKNIARAKRCRKPPGPIRPCTVLMTSEMTLICGFSHFSVNACLAPICSLHHVAVTTVEGIGNTQKLHPVQVSGW